MTWQVVRRLRHQTHGFAAAAANGRQCQTNDHDSTNRISHTYCQCAVCTQNLTPELGTHKAQERLCPSDPGILTHDDGTSDLPDRNMPRFKSGQNYGIAAAL